MLRTLWVWSIGTLATVGLGIILILVSLVNPKDNVLHRIGRLWARIILAAAGVKVKVSGLDNLIYDGPKILASNHQGAFDIFALFASIPFHFGWIAKKELFRIPIFGYAMKRYGNVRLDRADLGKARGSLLVAARSIQGGRSIIIFPEGTRSLDGKVRPFKKGCFHLAEASGAPVIPISISGSLEIMPKNHHRVCPGTIHLVVGRPMRVEGGYENDRKGFLDQLRQTICDNQVGVG